MLLKCKQIDQRLSCTDWFFFFVFCPHKCWHLTSIALKLHYTSKTFAFLSSMLKRNLISFLDNQDFSSSTHLIWIFICEVNSESKTCKISTLFRSIGETPYGHHAPPIQSFVDFGRFHNASPFDLQESSLPLIVETCNFIFSVVSLRVFFSRNAHNSFCPVYLESFHLDYVTFHHPRHEFIVWWLCCAILFLSF